MLVIVILFGVAYGLLSWRNLGNSIGYAPDQPFPFSHKLHAGDNQIPCLYCHSQADNSKHATVPSMNVCMNCHTVVRTDSPSIQKLTEMFKKGQPLEWIKVHDLPDFVYFSHERHVRKEVECEKCHGDVKTMEVIEQVKSLNMGFCVNCHREKKAPVDCSTCHQ